MGEMGCVIVSWKDETRYAQLGEPGDHFNTVFARPAAQITHEEQQVDSQFGELKIVSFVPEAVHVPDDGDVVCLGDVHRASFNNRAREGYTFLTRSSVSARPKTGAHGVS